MSDVERIAEDLYLVDTNQFGVPRCGGVYILRSGGEAALVESGTSLAVPRIEEALSTMGIPDDTVRWVFLTHIHLDHAGGAGFLLERLPEARVVVHRRGVKHLADPTKLLASVREATGDYFPFYGTAKPIPEERLVAVEGGEVFRLGELRVWVVPAPGHAPHHVCYHVPGPGYLFTGDAAGLWLEGKLLPATPPPSFDPEASLETLKRLRGVPAKLLLYTHYGPRNDPPRALSQYEELLERWVETVRRAWVKTGSEEEALKRLLADPWVRSLPYRGAKPGEELAMNIRGVLRYLARAS